MRLTGQDLNREEAEAARMRATARRDAIVQGGFSRVARDPIVLDKENLKAQVIKFGALNLAGRELKCQPRSTS